MKILSHNNKDVSIDNVDEFRFQGILDANYQDLVKVFGEPLEGDLYKKDAQWNLKLETNDGEFHNLLLYNFKNGKNYLGKDGLAVEKIPIWNVSTLNNDIDGASYIKRFLKQKLRK